MGSRIYNPDILPKNEARGILAMVQLNKVMARKEVHWKHRIGRIEFSFNWRSSKNLWGRFGGGWQWKLGFMASGKTIIFNLLIASIRISILNREE